MMNDEEDIIGWKKIWFFFSNANDSMIFAPILQVIAIQILGVFLYEVLKDV